MKKNIEIVPNIQKLFGIRDENLQVMESGLKAVETLLTWVNNRDNLRPMVLPPRFGRPPSLLFHAQSNCMFTVLTGTGTHFCEATPSAITGSIGKN